jgi:fido (protein-threonine AMPylation protein)
MATAAEPSAPRHTVPSMTPAFGEPFRGFRDHSESPFFRASGYTPEETWELSVDRFAELLVKLGPRAASGPIEMSTELLCSWHREIFGALFPDHAGRLRIHREDGSEQVYFGGHVGTRRSLRARQYRGTHPRRLRDRLEEICAEFNASAAMIRETTRADTFTAVYATTRLYAKLLRAHPWIDGNLRAAFVALNAGLLTLDLPRVEFKDIELHDDLLGMAFVGKNEPYRPLAEYIGEIIKNAEST